MIGITIMWFDKDRITGVPIYDNPHYKEFVGETPEACWRAVKTFDWNHDIVKHTSTRVVDVKTV